MTKLRKAPRARPPAKPLSIPEDTPSGAESFQSLIVGRRRQRRVEIRLACGSLTRVRSRAYVVGLFQGVQPAGASLAIDRAMDGVVTEFCQRRMMSNAVGEIFLLPRGRSDLRTEFVLFAGLGALDGFSAQVLETVAEHLARSAAQAGIDEFATVPMGANAGVPLEAAVVAYIHGFLRGLADADDDQHFRRLTLCEFDPARYETLKWLLFRLASTPLFDAVEVTLSELALPPAPVSEATAARGRGLGAVPTLYLHVRSEPLGKGRSSFASSLLTSGAKAVVIAGTAETGAAELDAQLALIETRAFTHKGLPGFGAKLARMVLPAKVRAALAESAGLHLAVVHDAGAARIPWETLHFAAASPALGGGLSRRFVTAKMSVAKWLEQRRQDATLQVLLVVNPTEDLDGAEKEGARLEELCARQPQLRLKKLAGSEATRARLLGELRSGQYDVLHYAGHAHFDPASPARSGLRCHDAILTGADLTPLANLPSLVFFNACESARLRAGVEKTKFATRDLRQRLERGTGLAEALLQGGVANYLGTYWPVGDEAAATFARVFYPALLRGEMLGRAVQQARLAVQRQGSPDWADYLQYGSFEFALKQPAATSR